MSTFSLKIYLPYTAHYQDSLELSIRTEDNRNSGTDIIESLYVKHELLCLEMLTQN
jgi:hypothetical protein